MKYFTALRFYPGLGVAAAPAVALLVSPFTRACAQDSSFATDLNQLSTFTARIIMAKHNTEDKKRHCDVHWAAVIIWRTMCPLDDSLVWTWRSRSASEGALLQVSIQTHLHSFCGKTGKHLFGLLLLHAANKNWAIAANDVSSSVVYEWTSSPPWRGNVDAAAMSGDLCLLNNT